MDSTDKQYLLNFLLNSKKLTRAQKKKRDYLFERDFSSVIRPGSQEGEPEPPQPQSHRPGISDEYISPKNIQHFLRDFNQDDVLKYTCHLIDMDEIIESICKSCQTDSYNYFKHLALIRNHFSELTKKYQEKQIKLSPNMVTLINAYLFGTNLKKKPCNWSSNDIDINWSCNQLIDWAKKNPGIIPNPGTNIAKKQNNSGFRLESAFKSKTTGKRIKSFSDLVIFFKCQFHIREENSLSSILNYVNQQSKFGPVNIAFSQKKFNDKIELLTDIDKIIQAYRIIVRMCVEHKQSDESAQLELSFYDDAETDYTYFCIHHLNSIYKKTQKNVIERIGETQSNLISKQINGLCDLFVEAVFGDNSCGRVNLWDESPVLEFQPINEKIEGVKYIMRF